VDVPERSHLLLYDGVCGLCNRLIQFILPRDPKGTFEFASLQSRVGRERLTKFGRDPDVLATFYVIADHRGENPRLLSKAKAGLFVLKVLGQPWSWMVVVLGVLPDKLLDRGYDLIARYRYRLFGRYESCPIPAPDHRKRFIDMERIGD
jgi:predicted DCC family thiol-disulfide oxidoreductase YuxK